jgi:Fic family protein
MLFTTPALRDADDHAISLITEAREKLAYAIRTPRRWMGVLRRSTLGRAIRGSNSIEGYVIPRDEVVAAAEGEAVEANQVTQQATETYRRAMTRVLGLATDPHFEWSAAMINDLHYMMMEYDLEKSPGQWRQGPIFVFDDEKNQTVYEGPDWALVPNLMAELVASLATPGDTPLVVQAAMAHLNLVMIHPFRDGNGRMARCLQTLVLGRGGTLEPLFSSIEEYLGRHTVPYYEVLSEVGAGRWHPERDALEWVRFCIRAHYYQAQTFLRRFEEAGMVMDALDEVVRKRKLPERMRLALWDAAFGFRVRNSTYRSAAEINTRAAGRDLSELAAVGLLEPVGERRGRYYRAAPAIIILRNSMRQKIVIPDPYRRTVQFGVTSTTTTGSNVSPIPASPSSTAP